MCSVHSAFDKCAMPIWLGIPGEHSCDEAQNEGCQAICRLSHSYPLRVAVKEWPSACVCYCTSTSNAVEARVGPMQCCVSSHCVPASRTFIQSAQTVVPAFRTSKASLLAYHCTAARHMWALTSHDTDSCVVTAVAGQKLDSYCRRQREFQLGRE